MAESHQTLIVRKHGVDRSKDDSNYYAQQDKYEEYVSVNGFLIIPEAL